MKAARQKKLIQLKKLLRIIGSAGDGKDDLVQKKLMKNNIQNNVEAGSEKSDLAQVRQGIRAILQCSKDNWKIWKIGRTYDEQYFAVNRAKAYAYLQSARVIYNSLTIKPSLKQIHLW